MRQLKLITAIATAALLVSGCGLTTIVTDTQAMKPAGNGVHLRAGDLQLSSLVVVTDADGAVLSGTAINRGDVADQIVGVSIDGERAILGTPEISLPVDSLVRLSFDGGIPVAVATSLAPGTSAVVDVDFASGAQIRGSVMVVAPTGAYANVDPAPVVAPVTPATE